jgi:hypothetical protein
MAEWRRERHGAPSVAIGPVMPGWGSWEWVGADLLGESAAWCRADRFDGWEVPDADVVVVVKHAPPPDWAEAVARRAAVVYCPVDFYGSATAIDADGRLLRRCARVVVHCERLRRYFAPYASVEYLDHHVKFAGPLRQEFVQQGYVLWVGVRSNLEALVAWVNTHSLPEELLVLTNPEDPSRVPRPADLGFQSASVVRVEAWSPARHLEAVAGARGALEIKGDDFRARHKPPAKAIDFLAAGVPLAMNPDSCVVEHLARLGFEVASPLDPGHWLSPRYAEETRRFGAALRELLSLERIGRRFRRIIEEVLAERHR